MQQSQGRCGLLPWFGYSCQYVSKQSLPLACTLRVSWTNSLIRSSTDSPAGTLTVQKGCIKYYTVKSGDYCEAIVTANSNVGLTLSQFYAANPAVNSQCTNLAVSSSYCVGVQAMPSVLAKSAAKKTTVGIPLPPTTSKPRLAVRTNAV